MISVALLKDLRSKISLKASVIGGNQIGMKFKRDKQTSLVTLSVAVHQVPFKMTVSFTFLKCYARISVAHCWKRQHN